LYCVHYPNPAQAIAHPQLTLKAIPAGPCTGLFFDPCLAPATS
jgi:hypothetical protein